MKTPPVILEITNSIARITFNRPDAYNAINTESVLLLHDIVNELYENKDVRAVVLCGSGEKAFCAGGDVTEFAKAGNKIESTVRKMTGYLHVAISRLAWLECPVIAEVQGVAAGAGLSFVAACDLAISSSSATYTSAYTKIGFTPDGSSTYFLPRLLGRKRVFELYFTNRVLSATEAMSWGIVNQVVPDDKLVDTTKEVAIKISQGPTKAFAGVKKLVMMSSQDSLESQMERETRLITEMTSSNDGIEGVQAFAQRRKPTFRGN